MSSRSSISRNSPSILRPILTRSNREWAGALPRALSCLKTISLRDAEAAYAKNPELTHEAATGRVNRAVRALQLETELRTDPQLRADRFVERWQKLDRTSQRQYQAGDMADYKATRSAMGDMAKSLERDPQLESLLANRKAALARFEPIRSRMFAISRRS